MKKVIRIFGLAMVVAALLVVSIGGAAFAANGPQGGEGNECPYCEGDGVCDSLCDGACNAICQNHSGEWGLFGDDVENGYGDDAKLKVRSGKE